MWIYLNIPLDVAQGHRTVLPEDIQSFLEEVTTKHYDTSEFTSPGITGVSKPPLCRFSLTLFFLRFRTPLMLELIDISFIFAFIMEFHVIPQKDRPYLDGIPGS